MSDAIYDRLAPDGGDTYNTFVHYDGPADRMVMRTTAPFSLTDPLVNDYPDMITVKPAPVGNVRMINVNSGKALDAAGCGTADGTGRAPARTPAPQTVRRGLLGRRIRRPSRSGNGVPTSWGPSGGQWTGAQERPQQSHEKRMRTR
ncbi:hypothetical protein AB0D74_00005 [Streptomyces sp. NPDC048278]|uniref:hypothetical protein n=1 Tax=Streptomyces sp. NPDC048278 TaxID=3155809 RepID=UPI003412D4A0